MKKNKLEMFRSKGGDSVAAAAMMVKERTKTDEGDMSNLSRIKKDNSVVQE